MMSSRATPRPSTALRVNSAKGSRGTWATLMMALLGACSHAVTRSTPPSYDVFAVRYGTLPRFRVSGLVAGADTSRRMDIAMMVCLMRGNGRNVLVDAGFYRQAFIDRWKPTDYSRPSDAVARAGVKPEDVTDIIVSHVHWDHMDGLDLFPNARVWIQREEYTHHVDASGKVLDRAVDAADAEMLFKLRNAGRVMLVDGDAQEIIPGITVYIGGKHTFQSQYATVKSNGGTVVLASDNLYLYENLDKRVPIAATLDRASNLAQQERMLSLASDRRLIVPGHDPAVFERFPAVSPGVVRIR
jgi:glyoxylase-like metal-dependent hydrolase (beta-lactamase superfamily II)